MNDGKAGRFPSGRLVIVLLVLSFALWALLAFVTVPQLKVLANGLSPFDVRFGYSYDEARAFLAAIGDVGRAYYLYPELVLDSIFPPLYAAFGVLATWWLTAPGRSFAAAMPSGWRFLLVAFPIAELVFDGAENAGIATMIRSWPDLSPGAVRVASVATQLKFVAAALTGVSLIALAALAALRRLRKN